MQLLKCLTLRLTCYKNQRPIFIGPRKTTDLYLFNRLVKYLRKSTRHLPICQTRAYIQQGVFTQKQYGQARHLLYSA